MAMQVAGRALGFWQLIREVSVDEIRREAELPFRLAIVAPEPARTALVEALAEGAGAAGPRSVYAMAPDWTPEDEQILGRASVVVVYVADGGIEAARRLVRLAGSTKVTSPMLFVVPIGATPTVGLPRSGDGLVWRETRVALLSRSELHHHVVPGVLALVPELALALGRALPAFRSAARQMVIGEVSRANAKVAALSNVPALVPIVGGLLGAAGDFVILTKNQIMLLYKLAAIHGRDVGQGSRLIAEVAPVIGAAFLWRSIARELIGLLPFLVGAIPKVLIAYTGTFVVGQMASFYYATGMRPPQGRIDLWYRQAVERVRQGLPGAGQNEQAFAPRK